MLAAAPCVDTAPVSAPNDAPDDAPALATLGVSTAPASATLGVSFASAFATPGVSTAPLDTLAPQHHARGMKRLASEDLNELRGKRLKGVRHWTKQCSSTYPALSMSID